QQSLQQHAIDHAAEPYLAVDSYYRDQIAVFLQERRIGGDIYCFQVETRAALILLQFLPSRLAQVAALPRVHDDAELLQWAASPPGNELREKHEARFYEGSRTVIARHSHVSIHLLS